MLYLLSPSKTLDETSPYPKVKPSQPAFLPESEALIACLRRLKEKDLAALMDISPKLAALTHQRIRDFTTPFTAKNARPALFMFKGDVYDGLDAYSLAVGDIAYANRHLRMLSGLYGLLRPLDYMQPYRLEMGTPLKNPRGKDLYAFWGAQLSEALNNTGADMLINLASQEYAAAIDRKALKLDEITVHFKEKRGNKLQVIGLFAKKARGMMARHLITERVETVSGITSFREGGYRFAKELSGKTDLVFTR